LARDDIARAFSIDRVVDRSQRASMSERLLLHRLSLGEATAELVPTSREIIRAQSFIDGRSDFSVGPVQHQSLDRFLSAEGADAPTQRYIFHVSFCGSTLLARLLDIPGYALVLREPNCLADLANQRAAADVANRNIAGWNEALAATGRHLARPWSEQEPVVVKPSNWANNLVPQLCENAGAVRPLFLTTTREAFVKAVFRGGPERMAYTARCAVHLSSAGRDNAKLVAAAVARDTNELGKLAALSIVTHSIQSGIFERTAKQGGWGRDHWLTLDDLDDQPLRSGQKAAKALDIDVSLSELTGSVDKWSRVHAKQPGNAFSSAQRAVEDRQNWTQHSDVISSALGWADEAIGR
jgi:hypothetical protein